MEDLRKLEREGEGCLQGKSSCNSCSTPFFSFFHLLSTLNWLISLFKCLNIPEMTGRERDNFHYTE